MSFEAFNLTAYAAEILDDRRILLAGYASSLDFGLVRLTADGLIDNQFGTNGRSTTPFGSGQDIGRSLDVQADGKILVAGYADKGNGNYDFAVARYNHNGSLDTTFGNAGKVTTPIGDPTLAGYYAYKIGLQSDGKIVVSGYSHLSASSDSYYDFSVFGIQILCSPPQSSSLEQNAVVFLRPYSIRSRAADRHPASRMCSVGVNSA